MILRNFLHIDPVGISYLFGCGGKATGAVVDPVGDIEPYLRAAEAAGMRIRFVIDTHVHADHLSAGRALAEAAGAEYVLSANADVSFPFKGVRDGDVLPLGNVIATVMHTPGHTPEHISLLVSDRTRADEPWFVLTGHTLMVGDLGRTELAVSAEEGASDLFRSAQRLKALPDYLEVLPGAYAGSVCGRRLSGKPWSTIGFEKRHNEAFGIDDEAEFVRFMLAEIPPAPPEAAGSGPQIPVSRLLRPRPMTEPPQFDVTAGRHRLGLKENWRQFALLVLINAFVGGMVGIERTVVPLIGAEEFGIASTTLVVSFIVSFGVVKALRQSRLRPARRRLGPQARAGARLARWPAGSLHDHLGAELGLDHRRQRAARRQSGPRLVDDGDHEDRSGRAEVARPRRRPQRIRRLSRRRRDGLPHRLSRLGIRPAAGADLSRRRLRDSRHRALDPARARHARPCPAGSRVALAASRLRSASARSSRSPPSRTATCSPPRRPVSSTISTTA